MSNTLALNSKNRSTIQDIYNMVDNIARQNNCLTIQSEICDFCGTCVAVCPEDCIILGEASIKIDFSACSMCMNCVKCCPLHIIKAEKES